MQFEGRSMMRIRNATTGEITYGEQAIISFLRDTDEKPIFLGTGFIISRIGLFVTAKHVLFEKSVFEKDAFAISFDKDGEPIQSRIYFYSWHKEADVMIGIIIPDGKSEICDDNYDVEMVQLNLNMPIVTGKVFTYAFPRSNITKIDDENVNMQYLSALYYGEIDEYLEKMPLANNCGYQCAIPIEPGCSGGPVFHESGVLIAINSASIKMIEGERPIMYASDIKLIEDLVLVNVALGSDEIYEKITIKQLKEKGFIR